MGSEIHARRSVPADEPGENGPFFGVAPGAKRLVTLRVLLVVFFRIILGILGSCKITHLTCHRIEVLETPQSQLTPACS